MDACIIGYGMVGKTMGEVFGITKYFSLHDSTITLKEAAACKYVFICLPTPVNADGTYETKDIEQIIKEIEGYGGAGIYILRSTVWPGYAEHLMEQLGIDRIVSNPEFLSEKTAAEDMKHPPFIVLGGVPRYVEDVRAFYESRIKTAPVMVADNSTAEMIKIALNAYFSVKTIFANQLYDICKKRSVNYERLKDVFEMHPYGPKNHFTIWFNGKRGVNGRCLQKDLKAFAHYTRMSMATLALADNENYIHEKNI